MSRINMTCAICDEDFKSTDVIQSTYCGHIFHKNCLEDWKLRQRSCPMCRQDYGLGVFDHQLFLTLDDREVNPEELEDLMTKLKSATEKNDQLQDQMNEKEFNFLQLQEQFTACEKSKQELEQKIREQIGTDDNFLGLQRQYTESTETIKDLKLLIQQMNIEQEKKAKDLDLKCVEISYLKNYSSESDGLVPDSVLKSQVHILEQKLKYISEQLEKEIANSTRLSIEKMKLESFIETTKNNRPAPSICEKKPENVAKQKICFNSTDTENSLVIENFPLKHIMSPLKNVIIDLGAKMHLSVCHEDICEVKILDKSECQQRSDEMIAIFVKFKPIGMNTKFLENKNLLKADPVTSLYILRQYVENANTLYIYAKEKLINNGFRQVFCKYNRVFAKRHDKSKPLQIFNRRHVDNFVKRHIEETTSKASDTKSLKNHEIDENFYQL